MYDSGWLAVKLFWKYLENIQKHVCIEFQVSLNYKFRKTKDWSSPYNDLNKELQNPENKLTGLHFGRAYSVSIKIN